MENKEIIRSILTEIKNGNTPAPADYHLPLDMWAEFIEYMHDKEYLTTVSIYWYEEDDKCYGEKVHSVDLTKARLTAFGEKFLTEE